MNKGKSHLKSLDATTLMITECTHMGCNLLQGFLSRPKYKIRLVGCAVTSGQALEVIQQQQPHVALISCVLQEGPLGGMQLLSHLHSKYPKLRTILLMDDADRTLVVEGFRNGARGVYFRTDPLDLLWKAIRGVHEGQIWASSRELQFLLEELGRVRPLKISDPRGCERLTGREKEVVGLVAEGYTNREISKELGLSEHTVKNYMFRVFDKLGFSTRTELAVYATRQQSQYHQERPVEQMAAPAV
ncbi:MAG: hypothetical protein A2722_01205 [Candidatus Doudnabacteria bacterium RIFCSPHIGHO2_01_FULL_50_11]|uniref:HTH luxR-type domain-containing protein n=1 Tax=Candidatus Doudnabacteria bacterium RIFCSPHIGHO2_01_FULL_50_11 TaxID=1817828 RepID=A0A1F5PE75_9BACT|nr:MAG: hypothetical protein A2722_01205 [Candidatus Doudnabacteria bacterium RIFCSPHIGHO2_01_FULL_50_11]HLC44824.1 response regulator transcription factor [Patescibacteria group bacterium]